MSLRVGLGASQADLDVQGEIDFDFFEESDRSNDTSKTLTTDQDKTQTSQSPQNGFGSNYMLKSDANFKDHSLNVVSNIAESSSSQYFNKPVITVSCDDVTGMVQKTTIETVIPTPFNYKLSKCAKASSSVSSKKSKPMLSPRLKNKIFSDDTEISDDSSLSSMSESESDLSSVSDNDSDVNEETDSMTDVTPLMSPYKCNSPMPIEMTLNKDIDIRSSPKHPVKEGVKFPDTAEKKECSKCEAIDINELLRAVKRLEMGQNINTSVCKEKCLTPSVITQNAKSRKNLSFSNEEVRRIDNDNKVLLKKIIAQQNRTKSLGDSSSRVVSSASVNRQRQQRQIELENLALLKRLEGTKASRDVSRFHLLRDYDRRASGVLSRTSSRTSKPGSLHITCCTSNVSSGRSSVNSIKSTNSMSSIHRKS